MAGAITAVSGLEVEMRLRVLRRPSGTGRAGKSRANQSNWSGEALTAVRMACGSDPCLRSQQSNKTTRDGLPIEMAFPTSSHRQESEKQRKAVCVRHVALQQQMCVHDDRRRGGEADSVKI